MSALPLAGPSLMESAEGRAWVARRQPLGCLILQVFLVGYLSELRHMLAAPPIERPA